MSRDIHRRVAASYPWLAGLIFLALGLATFVHPEILSYYRITIEGAEARIATRAIIGGGEIALATLLLIGGSFGLKLRQRSQIGAVVFATVGVARLSAGLIESPDALMGQPLRETAIEIALGLLGFWAAQDPLRP